MAYFYSIRGWLEVEPDKFEKAMPEGRRYALARTLRYRVSPS